MYRGFVGTVLSHFLSLISTLWAIFKVHGCKFESEELFYIRLGLFLIAANSSLALVRYDLFGSKCYFYTTLFTCSSDGYKLRRVHIITLNVSAILNFTITESAFLHINKLSMLCQCFPVLNFIPLLSNSLAKDYRTKFKVSDVFIGINCLFLLIVSILYENYYAVALSMSYFFGYFIIGEIGYFLDTEVPSVDAFQYLTCFLNFFTVYTLCY